MYTFIIAGFVGVILGYLTYLIVSRKNKRTDKEKLLPEGLSDKVIASIPDMIFIVDKDYWIREILNADTTRLQIPPESLIGMNLKDCVGPEDVDQVLGAIRKALDSRELAESEYSITVNGQKEYYEGRYKRIDADLVACFERNISERKKAEHIINQNEFLFNEVINNLPMPLLIKDVNNDFKYVFWNQKSEELGGYRTEEVLGKNDIEIYGEERGQYYWDIDEKVVREGKPYHGQDFYIGPNGEKHVSIVDKNLIVSELHSWLMVTSWNISDLIKIQDELEEVNQQLRIAFSATSSVPVVWDIDSDILSFKFIEFKDSNNGFVMDKKGLSSAETIANIHPDEREDIRAVFDALKNNRIENAHREIHYDVMGEYTNCYDLYMTIEKRDKNGNPLRVIGSMRNITEAKKNEQSIIDAKKNIEVIQKMNQLILDNSNSGLVYITPDYIVQWENVTRYKEFAVAARYQTGICCYKNLMDLSEPCEGCVAQKAFASGRMERTEIQLDEGAIIEVTATPVFDANMPDVINGVVLKFDDVTTQRSAALELERAKEAAETSDKLKSMFLSNMSHEIRTPLNAIVGFSELLTQTEDPKEKEEFMAVISRNNELLLQLINDILDLSKIEANTLEFVYSNVDINEMLGNMQLSNSHKVDPGQDVKIYFTPQLDDCVIHSEKNRLQQVLLNLINNALKFTEQGSITIGYELVQEGMRFFVTDTGRGIPEEKQRDIFKRFVKLDSFANGTGLGLAICQTIIQKLGGKIGVESEEGKGSTFWFTLPIMPLRLQVKKESEETTQAFQAVDKEKVAVAGDGRQVLLIAEDTVDNYRLYQTLLAKKYTLLHAWNGREVVEMHEQHHPDLIIMDIKMPEMDGYEATALIRQKDTKVPIIAASAYAFSEDIARIMRSGFNDYISKPLNKQALYNALEKLQ